MNRKKHACGEQGLDACSSARWFTGWRDGPHPSPGRAPGWPRWAGGGMGSSGWMSTREGDGEQPARVFPAFFPLKHPDVLEVDAVDEGAGRMTPTELSPARLVHEPVSCRR